MRRIQIYRIKRTFYANLELVIYAPAGKFQLEHDSDMLLYVIAAMLSNGWNGLHERIGWVVNGQPIDESGFVNQLHGYAKQPIRPHEKEDEVIGRELLFDAGEVVHAGRVHWNVTTGSRLGGNILTPAEMLGSAAKILIS